MNTNAKPSLTAIFAGITGFISFVSTVVGFIKLWRGEATLVTAVLLVVGIAVFCGVCLWVRTRTREADAGFRRSARSPYYPSGRRRLALAGLITLPLSIAAGAGYWWYELSKPPSKIIIVVADIGGPDPQKYRVTETILTRLRTVSKAYSDIEVDALGRAITAAEGSAIARAEGQKRKATIVIWGWHGATAQAAPVSIDFEVLRPPPHMPGLAPDVEGRIQNPVIAELETFALQTRLSAEMAYLSLFTVAMARYAARDVKGAIKLFNDAAAQTADLAPAADQSSLYLYRGISYFSENDFDHAIADYNQAITLQPDLAAAYTDRGAAHIRRGEYDQALSDFDQAVKLRPDIGSAYLNRGIVHIVREEYDQAFSDLDQALKLQPNLAPVYLVRAKGYLKKGELDRAMADFDEFVRRQPTAAEGYYDRGVIFNQRGQLERAIAEYDKAIKVQPNFAAAYCNRGVTYVARREFDRGIADLTQAIKLAPNFSLAYNSRGSAYGAKGDFDQAISDFSRAIDLNPNDAEAYHNRGVVYKNKKNGNYDAAIADLTKAIDLKPDYGGAYLERGKAYFTKKDYEHAIVDYNRTVDLEPHLAVAYFCRGLTHKEMGNKGDAIRDFKEAFRISNDPALREGVRAQLRALGAK